MPALPRLALAALFLLAPATPQPPPPPPVAGRICGAHAMLVEELLEEMRDNKTSCLAVKFSGGQMRAQEVVDLAAELKAHPTRRFQLTDTQLGDDKVEILAPSISVLLAAGCADVTLARVGMGDRGAAAIAAAFSEAFAGKPLHRGVNLDLSGNRIADMGAERLAKALSVGVGELTVQENEIGDSGANALQEALQFSKLRLLDLGGNFLEGSVMSRLRLSKNAEGVLVTPGDAAQRPRPVAPPTAPRRQMRESLASQLGDAMLEGMPPAPRTLGAKMTGQARRNILDDEFIPSRVNRPPPAPAPPPPPQPPAAGGAVDWEAAYDAVEGLQDSGLLPKAAAKRLRRMAAKDEPALGRIYNRFKGKPVKLLAERLLELIEDDREL